VGTLGTIKNNLVYSKQKFPGQTGWATIPTVLPDSGDVTHHPFEGEINHFVECILSGTASPLSLADAAITHRICYALDQSAAEGRTVAVQDIPV